MGQLGTYQRHAPARGLRAPVTGPPLSILALHPPGLGRRQFLRRAAAALGAAGLAACGRPSRRSLNIYNYSNYIAGDTIARFQAETGISVVYDEFSSQDVLFAKLKLGAGYDLVVASDYMLRRLLRQQILAPVEGFRHRDGMLDRFRHPPWDPELRYSVPYLWGTTGVGYNRRMVQGRPDSWDALWDPAYAGHITMLDEKRDTLGAALIRLGFSGNSMDRTELLAAARSLDEQKPLLKQYTNDYIDGLARNEVWLALAWSGDVARAHSSNPDIDFFLPREGGFVFVDSWCIPREAPHPEEAVAFLNFLMQPPNLAAVTNATGFPATIARCRDLVRPELLDNPLGYPPRDMLERTVFQKDLGAGERVWDEIWEQVKFRSVTPAHGGTP